MTFPYRLAGTRVQLDGSPTLLPDDPQPPLGKITISGKDFIHKGESWKAIGIQGNKSISHEEEIDILNDVGSYNKQIIDNINDFRQSIGPFNVVREYAHMWAIVDESGGSIADLKPRPQAIDNLMYRIRSNAARGMHTIICANITWLGDAGAPSWFDALTYTNRWEGNQKCLEYIVQAVVDYGLQNEVMAYELTSEPSQSTNPSAEWYGNEALGYYYVPNLARGPGVDGNTARDWVTQMVNAVKAIDPDALTTIGQLAIPNPVGGAPQTGGPYAVDNVDDLIDFHSPHISVKTTQGIAVSSTIAGTLDWVDATTKPVMLGEFQALSAGGTGDGAAAFTAELDEFLQGAGPSIQGVIGFTPQYDGENDAKFPTYTEESFLELGLDPEELGDVLPWIIFWEGATSIIRNRVYIG